MSNIQLENLNAEFKKIWFKTNDVPRAMAKWQEQLQQVTATMEPTDENLELLAALTLKWQDIMQKNKELLLAHQKDLKEKLKKGESTFLKSKAAEKFKKN